MNLTEKQKKEICGEYRQRKDNEIPREVVENIAAKYGISKGAVAEVLGKNGEDIKAICYGRVGRPKKETGSKQEVINEMAAKATIKKSVTKKETQEKKKFEAPAMEECNDSVEQEDARITVDLKSKDGRARVPEKIIEFAKGQMQEIRQDMEKMDELERKIEDLKFSIDYGFSEYLQKVKELHMCNMEWYITFICDDPDNHAWYLEMKEKMDRINEK